MPHTAPDISYVTSTACALLGVAPPAGCTAACCEPLLAAAGGMSAAEGAATATAAASADADAIAEGAAPGAGLAPHLERLLIYAPDAVGMHLLGRFPGTAQRLRDAAPHEVRTRAVSPSVTPVCFATMFSGMPPAAHGITRYEKPVLKSDTLFDALLRAGRSVALAAVRHSSIDTIFRGRALDYFSEDYDPEVTARTLRLLQHGGHDVIVAYHQEYDDLLHQSEPFSPGCLCAFERHCESFLLLLDAAARFWRGRRWAAVFAPDHGAHYDAEARRGMHGSELAADMELAHFWSFS